MPRKAIRTRGSLITLNDPESSCSLGVRGGPEVAIRREEFRGPGDGLSFAT
jgi:hypothetical protein